MEVQLRLVGDVHGNIAQYIDLVKNIPYSIQLGDLGFRYNTLVDNISSEFHKVLAGNHDNYDRYANKIGFIHQTEHFLGDYGIHSVPDCGDFFFVRGGESVDKSMRIVGYDWWLDEELSYEKCSNCLESYSKIKPNIVISHECPESVIKFVSGLGMWGEIGRAHV